MTAYTIVFGKLGDTYPVPPLDTNARTRAELVHQIEQHAHPFINPTLRALGRPELADPIFQPNEKLTGGQFIVPKLSEQTVDRFCAVRIEEQP